MRKIYLIFLFLLLLLPSATIAQEGGAIEDRSYVYKAEVVKILESGEISVPGTDVKNTYQKIEAKILEGEKLGEVLLVENDYFALKEGQKFYLLETTSWETGNTLYYVKDIYRLPIIYVLLGIFLVCIVVFGGIQGVRGLASLIGSLVLIIFILLPGILGGYSPILVTIGVSALIIVIGSYITHGFNRTTSSAVIGMIVTVVITGLLAFLAIHWAGLTGFESEESVYLNWNTGGTINFVGLLFGGIMIGLLGVLYDVAIGQAIAVEEIRNAGLHMNNKQIFKRVLRIGKEHTGALVNTLAIAYVGASLPLLLLFYSNGSSTLAQTINSEIFSTEIIRTLVGSIGLVLAVPITTLISVFMLVPGNKDGKHKTTTHSHSHHRH